MNSFEQAALDALRRLVSEEFDSLPKASRDLLNYGPGAAMNIYNQDVAGRVWGTPRHIELTRQLHKEYYG